MISARTWASGLVVAASAVLGLALQGPLVVHPMGNTTEAHSQAFLSPQVTLLTSKVASSAVSGATSGLLYGAAAGVILLICAVITACTYACVFALPQALCDQATRQQLSSALYNTYSFYAALCYYLVLGRAYPAPYFDGNTQARVQVYSLALVFRMWSRPHYRNGTFHEDMIKNLRNVAIPGTGIPLSVVCCCKPVAVVFLLVFYPLACLVAALNLHSSNSAKVARAYSDQLLCPQDWFSFWQLNCRLATHHASVTGASGYGMEDKLDFLETAKREGIAVTPWMTMPKVIVKHRNEEGGLGFHAFDNCTSGGNWIIQEALENDEFVASLLPDDAPLSTFRVISASRGGMDGKGGSSASEGDGIQALSCVFRAGRKGAATDHVSVLYDVDMSTGVIGEGTTNMHWYQIGIDKIFTTPWTNNSVMTKHPDTGREVTGTKLPDLPGMLAFVERAHARMMPDVPLAGWDVAFTNKGMVLLEANLSCNFFRGSFDKGAYFSFVDDYFHFLHTQERVAKQT